MMNKIKIFMLVAVGLLILPISALAFDVRGGESIEINKDQVIEDDLMIAGANVRINGIIKGDVKAVGSIIEVNGIVEGDVAAVGSQVTIRGNVNDDLYAAGGQVNIENKIGDNVFVAGGNVYLAEEAVVGRDLRVYGGVVYLDGQVMRDVEGGVGQMNITNNINGNLAGEYDKLSIGPNVQIKGNMDYSSPEEAVIDSSADIAGTVNWTKTESNNSYMSDERGDIRTTSILSSFIWKMIKVISLIVLGLILVIFFPKEIRKLNDRLAQDPGNSILWGLLIVIVIPIIALMLLLTVIGAPLSLLLVLAYILAIYLAKVVVSMWLGRSLLLSLSKKKDVSLRWSVVIGALIVGILCAIPVAGFIFKLIVLLFGVGVIFMSIRDYFNKRK